MKEDLISGLKNAVERGFSIDSVVNSFINAGYNPEEVKEAASYISQGATSLTVQKSNNSSNSQNNSSSSIPDLTPASSLPSLQPMPKKKSHTLLIVILTIVLLILASGIMGMLFFKDKIASIFPGII